MSDDWTQITNKKLDKRKEKLKQQHVLQEEKQKQDKKEEFDSLTWKEQQKMLYEKQ